MTELSIFQNFNKVVAQMDFESIALQIKNGKYKQEIEKLQAVLLSGNEKEYSNQKKSLLAFTPSAKFEGGRKIDYLIEYSRIIILDIDKINHNIELIKEKANHSKFTYSCFISPSGKGLKILVRTENSLQKHKETFLKIQKYYEKLLGVPIDPSGKDVTRLCFFSYDSDIYINQKSTIFKTQSIESMNNDVEKLIEQIDNNRIDITSNYDDWLKVGFAIESEFGESGRHYFHAISKHNNDYTPELCNEQFSKCVKNNNSGISIKTLFHIAKQHGIVIKSLNKDVELKAESKKASFVANSDDTETTNKFTITENYLNKYYDVRYNVVSNQFEYKMKNEDFYQQMNENNMFIHLQKNNINISLNHLVALLKSDFVREYHVFKEYFESLPIWDGYTDHIQNLCFHLKTTDRKRLDIHFKKWLVRAIRTAIDDNYFNKQAFVLVTTKQNSGKSTFCRFLCPYILKDYMTESIGTDKDSLIAITENFLINLDELSQAEKAEINAFKSMFSKDRVKARLTYDKRPTVHTRRASFIGSTDRWEFLTDENGSVRWLCFEIDEIDWNYKSAIDINKVWAQAYFLLTKTDFEYDLTADEIKENDYINKKYQVSSPERDLLQKFIKPSNKENGEFLTATDILEYILGYTFVKINPAQIGKELKFLGFERTFKYIENQNRYGYFVEKLDLDPNRLAILHNQPQNK